MNYDDDKKIDNVTPYKATGNLNTAISNPTVHINDAMNMNIKSVNTVQNNNTGVNTPDNIPVTNNYNTMNLVISLMLIIMLLWKLIIRMLIIQM